ncbi:MAG: phytoene synthase [Rhodobacteraceae bacterium HLUCCO18]|nr:MAG: phytoene synthase [Rhodobacteraceae bacterium HLUCCO18]
MSLQACAELVARGDPDRFRAAMVTPPEARAALFPLYAFNVEVSRAPWVTEEPMIAEMRLQFWRDVTGEIAQGTAPRAHEVALPLAGVVRAEDAGLLDGLVAARRWDIYKDAFEDQAHFERYLDATGGNLAWVAARALGAPDAAEGTIRDAAFAAALARFLVAVPELEARGRIPLVDGRPEAISALAAEGRGRLARARTARAGVPRKAGHALYDGWQAEALLKRAEADPLAVAEGRLSLGAFGASWRLARLALTGRW